MKSSTTTTPAPAPAPPAMPATGGSYVRQPDGSLQIATDPTQDHPEGNAPRAAQE